MHAIGRGGHWPVTGQPRAECLCTQQPNYCNENNSQPAQKAGADVIQECSATQQWGHVVTAGTMQEFSTAQTEDRNCSWMKSGSSSKGRHVTHNAEHSACDGRQRHFDRRSCCCHAQPLKTHNVLTLRIQARRLSTDSQQPPRCGDSWQRLQLASPLDHRAHWCCWY